MNNPPSSARSFASATVGALLVASAFAFVLRFSMVFLALGVAVVIGTGVLPLVDRLARRGLSRTTSAVIALGGCLVVLASLLCLGLPMVIARCQTFIARLPAYQQTVRDEMLRSSSGVVRHIAEQMPSTLRHGELPQGALSLVTSTLGSAGAAIGLGAAVLLFAFCWAARGRTVVARLFLLAPRERRRELRALAHEAELRLGAYVRGQFIVCGTLGVASFCAYSALRLPDALVLALLAALFETIPTLGPILGAIPAILVALTVSPPLALAIVGIAIALHLLESLVLVPRVMRRAVGVHPALCLLAVAAMGTLLGLPGAVLAIPTAAIAQLAIDHLLASRRAALSSARSARAWRAALREEVHALAHEAELLNPRSHAEREIQHAVGALAFDLDVLLGDAPVITGPRS